MHPVLEHQQLLTRRHFLGRTGLGAVALAWLMNEDRRAAAQAPASGGLTGLPHFAAKAKRVICLFQSGAPSQLDLFDYKPKLNDLFNTDLPDSIRKGQRLTTMTSTQANFPIAPSRFRFQQRGQSGAWVSDLLRYTATVADELCFI